MLIIQGAWFDVYCFSIVMIFISFENYKDGKSIFDKTIESKIIKMCIIFYYIFLALSTMFYIYESIAQYKANGAYIMVAATTIMLDVVNRSIHKENFDNSKMVWGKPILNMERKQELDFENKWIEERTNGFWKYYVKHLGGVVMIMFGIFVASCIAKKEINAIYLLVSMVVAGIFPFLAWAINEIRIKANESRNGNEKRKQ